jgi:hypothetical protein
MSLILCRYYNSHNVSYGTTDRIFYHVNHVIDEPARRNQTSAPVSRLSTVTRHAFDLLAYDDHQDNRGGKGLSDVFCTADAAGRRGRLALTEKHIFDERRICEQHQGEREQACPSHDPGQGTSHHSLRILHHRHPLLILRRLGRERAPHDANL